MRSSRIVRLYPLNPEVTAADLLMELAAHYVDVQTVHFRSARSIHKRLAGMKQAYVYFQTDADASLFAGIFQNTTHHPILMYRYSFVPDFVFGPYAFTGTLHARLVSRRPLRQLN